MATVNLLPWRDQYRQERKKIFFSFLAILMLLAFLLAYILLMVIQSQLEQQRVRNALFKEEIVELEAKVKEIVQLQDLQKKLESKVHIIQGLQNKRSLIVHYFDEIVRAVPDGIYLTRLQRKANNYSIKGVSESNNRVSTFMRNLDRSEYFKSPNLKTVVKGTFYLTVETVDPSVLEFTASK